MSEDKEKGIDILNLDAIGKPLDTATKSVFEGAGVFLSKICLPAAEEFGLLLKDKVSIWRAKNMAEVVNKAAKKMNQDTENNKKHGHPRLVCSALNNSSWIDVEEVQDMWAGLLTSSCTYDGKDDSNLIFINILAQMTSPEVKILNFVCKKAKMEADSLGLVTANSFRTTKDELSAVSEINDVYRIDRELDHLNALDLIEGYFGLGPDDEEIDDSDAYLEPTPLGINMYVRSQGSLLPPVKFFNIPFSL